MDGEAGWWTTSGNIGLPPLARVMGVGRQQQPILGYIKIALRDNKYKHNFEGPKTEAWGTPQIILAKSDKTLSIWTRWVRLENMT